VKGSVLMICAEDDFENTVKPRLIAASGKPERVGAIRLARERPWRGCPPESPGRYAADQAHGKRPQEENRPSRSNSLSLTRSRPIYPGLSTTGTIQVRQALLPLKEYAKDADLAVLMVRHLTKEGSMRAMYRGGGSIAFSQQAEARMCSRSIPLRRAPTSWPE
jgi:hypothetical protein